jgi:intracellular sulfur oxidation DsrE/DsrF family protein
MNPIDRRGVLGSLAAMAAGGPALAQTAPPPAAPAAVGGKPTTPLKELKKDADIACVYHCDFGDPARFSQMLTNVSNHFSAYGDDPFAVQLAIVAHGPGVKFFLSSLETTQWRDELTVPQIYPRAEAMFAHGLKVYLCAITFERLKIDRALARPHANLLFTPSGVATLGDLQAKGFGYIKVG